ncbi:CaiB/BaiF CoA transferase family protein [Chloroflexota bacterium]
MDREALSGLKVLEYSEFISGPYCGKLLANLGAEVIKVEPPGLGDKARSWGPFPNDIPHPEKSGLFLYLNTNKLGVTLNMGTVAGIKIFTELVKQVDVLIESNPPHEMEWLGLDYEYLHQINPKLVVTSITLFGQTGPYHDYKGCDLIGLHTGGEAFINPSEGVDDLEQEPPLKVPAHSGDTWAGLSAAICTMAAVTTQQATGVGQHVDLSQQDAIAYMPCQEFGQYNYGGTVYHREREKRGGVVQWLPVFPHQKRLHHHEHVFRCLLAPVS